MMNIRPISWKHFRNIGVSTLLLNGLVLTLLIIAATQAARAQSFLLDLPLKSQHSEIMQRIGLTDIRLEYSRPLVNGRKIWDGLVPYGQVWRTGANTNTKITFSDPVTVEGRPLESGTYGLHTIPNADEWIIIFSKNSTSWGSFTYDRAEDALRVTVKPQPSEMHEALSFQFDDLKPDSAVITLRWERIAIPIKVEVDVHSVVRASLKKQLRTLSRYNWISWNDAANYLLTEKTDMDVALAYADKSIDNEDRFENEITRSKVLQALDRGAEASAAQKKALALGTPLQLHQYALELITSKRVDAAAAILKENAVKHPELWFVHEGMARVFSEQGRPEDAKKEIKQAIAIATADQKKDLNEMLKRLEATQKID